MPPARWALPSLLAVMLAFGYVSGSRSGDEVALESGRFFSESTAIGKPFCEWSCDGDKSGTKPALVQGDGEPPKEHECWGTFKFWCKASDEKDATAALPDTTAASNNVTAHFWGAICRGHFKTISWQDQHPIKAAAGLTSERKRIVVCEGGHKWISGRVSTCPHTGDTYKSLRGSWSLGATVDILSITDPSAPDLTPRPNDGSSKKSGSSAAVGVNLKSVSSAMAQFRGMADESMFKGEAAMRMARMQSRMAAWPHGSRAHAANVSDRSFDFEGRSEGVSGEWRAVKRISRGDEVTLGATAVEEETEALLHPSWGQWLSGLLSWRGHGPEDDHKHEGEFGMLCNRRPAWLHGALPCWGNFTVWGKRTSSSGGDSNATASATSTATNRRALTATTAQLPAIAQPKRQQSVGGGWSGSTSMDVECDGLWTGLFGKTCIGLNTAFSEVLASFSESASTSSIGSSAAVAASTATGDALSASEPSNGGCWSLHKWAICSGRQNVKFVNRKDTWGMGVACKGRKVTKVSVTVAGEEESEGGAVAPA